MLRLSVALAVLLLTVSAADAASCVDESGNPVDYWFIYKLPGT